MQRQRAVSCFVRSDLDYISVQNCHAEQSEASLGQRSFAALRMTIKEATITVNAKPKQSTQNRKSQCKTEKVRTIIPSDTGIAKPISTIHASWRRDTAASSEDGSSSRPNARCPTCPDGSLTWPRMKACGKASWPRSRRMRRGRE